MTIREAIETIEPLCLALASDENFECYGDCNDCKDKHARRLEEAKKLAIKSLELMNAYDMATKALEQTRPKGTWIGEESLDGSIRYMCDNCKEFEYVDHYNFCPNCGAKMEVEE